MLHQLKQPPKINLVPEAARGRKQSWWRDGARNRNGCTETGPECYQGDENTANRHRLKHLPPCCHHHQPVVNYNLILYNILVFHTEIGNHYLWDLFSYWIKLMPTMSIFYLFFLIYLSSREEFGISKLWYFLTLNSQTTSTEPSPPEFNKATNPALLPLHFFYLPNTEESELNEYSSFLLQIS